MKQLDGEWGLDQRAWSDLRLVVGRWDLVKLTLVAIQQVEDEMASTRHNSRLPPTSRDRTILTLLAYGYAAGILGSPEIEEAIYQDKVMRYISAGEEITWHELRRFRRGNRVWLHQVLSRLLELAAERVASYGLGPSREPEASCRFTWPSGLTGLEGINARDFFQLAAEQRIQQAIQIDSLAMDD